jgi:hypothetical protein
MRRILRAANSKKSRSDRCVGVKSQRWIPLLEIFMSVSPTASEGDFGNEVQDRFFLASEAPSCQLTAPGSSTVPRISFYTKIE